MVPIIPMILLYVLLTSASFRPPLSEQTALAVPSETDSPRSPWLILFFSKSLNKHYFLNEAFLNRI